MGERAVIRRFFARGFVFVRRRCVLVETFFEFRRRRVFFSGVYSYLLVLEYRLL